MEKVRVADGLYIRDAVIEDISPVRDDMREEDALEVLSEGAASVDEALRDSFYASSVRLAVERDGVPVALFGLAPDSFYSPHARVWFLGSNGMRSIPKSFVKASRLVISWFLDMYPVIYNRVDSRYTGTIRWLKSCGAEFQPPHRVNGFDFEGFVIRRKS